MGYESKHLFLARRRVRASQALAATIARVARPTIVSLEAGGRQPKTAEILSLASLYRVRPEVLLSASPPESPPPVQGAVAFRTAHAGAIPALDAWELQDALRDLPATSVLPSLPDVSQLWPVPAQCAAIRHLTSERDGPFDPFRTLDAHRVGLRFTALEKVDAAILRDDQGACVVIVNSSQPDDRLRWSAAHELAHLALRHSGQTVEHIDLHGTARTSDDREADLFAAELLMPGDAVLSWLRDNSPGPSPAETVYRLAGHFLVSYAAAVIRLHALGALTSREMERLRSERPTEIEARLKLKASRSIEFEAELMLPCLAAALVSDGMLPIDWHTDFLRGWIHVRRLQAESILWYIRNVPARDRASSIMQVQHAVASWVAHAYPCRW